MTPAEGHTAQEAFGGVVRQADLSILWISMQH
jgi:hypothetical protein